jgi:cytoskeletal protein RodZ
MLEIGSSLREARQRRRLDLSEVEKETRIRVQQLEALEHDRFELLPPDPYRRAFLREYADYLGLDGDLYASEYDLRFAQPPETTPTQPPRLRQRRAPLLGRRPMLTTGSILLAVVIGVLAWQFGRPGGSPITTPTPPTAAHTRTQARPHAHKSTPPQTPSSTQAARTLVLAATRGRCWLWVRAGSSTGPTMYEQTLQQGQTIRFALHRPLWIRIGAPWNIDATLAHQSLTLPAHTGDVLATPSGLTPAP